LVGFLTLFIDREIFLKNEKKFYLYSDRKKMELISSSTSSGILMFIDKEIILSYFKDRQTYKNFIFRQAEHQRELEKIKHLIILE
jgi:hypothetical protein